MKSVRVDLLCPVICMSQMKASAILVYEKKKCLLILDFIIQWYIPFRSFSKVSLVVSRKSAPCFSKVSALSRETTTCSSQWRKNVFTITDWRSFLTVDMGILSHFSFEVQPSSFSIWSAVPCPKERHYLHREYLGWSNGDQIANPSESDHYIPGKSQRASAASRQVRKLWNGGKISNRNVRIWRL